MKPIRIIESVERVYEWDREDHNTGPVFMRATVADDIAQLQVGEGRDPVTVDATDVAALRKLLARVAKVIR